MFKMSNVGKNTHSINIFIQKLGGDDGLSGGGGPCQSQAGRWDA